MKVLKTIGILFLIVFAIATILSIVMPTSQRIERSILIDAKAPVVYDYLSRLSNFNKWSVWNQNDSTIRNTITGTDGTLGAFNTWVGDPGLSGEGKMTITQLEINEEIKHDITFLKPREMNAKSEFNLVEVNGQTKVTWTFDLATPRPWNIFNLFSNIGKRMGKDFENGLFNLKALIEKNTVASASMHTYEVMPLNFPATSYISYRQQVSADDRSSFYASHFPRLYVEAVKLNATPGSPSCLFYDWNNSGGDIAAGIPVSPGTSSESDSVQVIDLPGSKAVYVDYYGAYHRTADAYNSIDRYLESNGLKKKLPVIEQYITDPAVEKDTAKWLTRIIFLVE
jgi:effector-binding domain-containing protein